MVYTKLMEFNMKELDKQRKVKLLDLLEYGRDEDLYPIDYIPKLLNIHSRVLRGEVDYIGEKGDLLVLSTEMGQGLFAYLIKYKGENALVVISSNFYSEQWEKDCTTIIVNKNTVESLKEELRSALSRITYEGQGSYKHINLDSEYPVYKETTILDTPYALNRGGKFFKIKNHFSFKEGGVLKFQILLTNGENLAVLPEECVTKCFYSDKLIDSVLGIGKE